jgi:hypothetical protein
MATAKAKIKDILPSEWLIEKGMDKDYIEFLVLLQGEDFLATCIKFSKRLLSMGTPTKNQDPSFRIGFIMGIIHSQSLKMVYDPICLGPMVDNEVIPEHNHQISHSKEFSNTLLNPV